MPPQRQMEWLPTPTYHLNSNPTPITPLTPTQAQAALTGTYCTLTPLNADAHTADLYTAFQPDMQTRFDYLRYGPFASEADLHKWIQTMTSTEPATPAMLYAVIVQGKAVGFLGYLRWKPHNGTVEIGHVNYSTSLSGTPAATETMYMLLNYAISHAKYRRLEWKCNAENQKSFNAALRYGYAFEGIFKQCEVIKGHNRNTGWFSVTDDEWDKVAEEFQRYLNKDNFDGSRHKTRLNGFAANLRNEDSTVKETEYWQTYVNSKRKQLSGRN